MPLSEKSDVELVTEFKSGNAAAFDAIVERFQDRVYRLACVWLYDPQHAEDAAQEVFMRAPQRPAPVPFPRGTVHLALPDDALRLQRVQSQAQNRKHSLTSPWTPTAAPTGRFRSMTLQHESGNLWRHYLNGNVKSCCCAFSRICPLPRLPAQWAVARARSKHCCTRRHAD